MSAPERGGSLLVATALIFILGFAAVSLEAAVGAQQHHSQMAAPAILTLNNMGLPEEAPPSVTAKTEPKGSTKEECSANSKTLKEADGKTPKKVGKFCSPSSELAKKATSPEAKANCQPNDGIPAGTCWVKYCNPTNKDDCFTIKQVSEPSGDTKNFTTLRSGAVQWRLLVPEEKVRSICTQFGCDTGEAPGADGLGNAFKDYEKFCSANPEDPLCPQGVVPRTDQPDLDAYCKNNPAACNPSTLKPEEFKKAYCENSPDEPGCNGIVKVEQCPPGQTGSPSCKPGGGCTGDLCGKGPGGGTSANPGDSKSGSGLNLGNLTPLLGSFLKGFLGGLGAQQAPSQACSTDPNVYAQQQQQYQQQLQQYNYQLQQYNYQQAMNDRYGYGGTLTPPVQPSACTPSTGQQCGTQPAQPAASSCSAGTWQPTKSDVCITGWQCVPNTSGAPTAAISCEPKTADVGMTLNISYSCSAGFATSTSFTIASSTQSGTATTTIQTPPAGTNTATYSLTCNNNGVTAGAQCNVQVVVPSIILVANPKSVNSGETSLVGWITTGMASCVVSSSDDSDFTTRNSSNTSTSGTATTSTITANTNYLLHCQTAGGGVRDATTTVTKL